MVPMVVQVDQARTAVARTRRTSEDVRTRPVVVAIGYCWLATYTARQSRKRINKSGLDNLQDAK